MQFHVNASKGDSAMPTELSCAQAGDAVTMVIFANGNAIPFNSAPHLIAISLRTFCIGLTRPVLFLCP